MNTTGDACGLVPCINDRAVIKKHVGRQKPMVARCPHCDAPIPTRAFRLTPDWCPECRRSLHSVAAPLFAAVRGGIVRHRVRIGIIASILIAGWLALAAYRLGAAQQSLQQSFGALDPVWRMQLTPMDPDRPPELKVSYWQFVINPFRDDVWIEYDFSFGGSGGAWCSMSDWHSKTSQ